MLKQGISRKKHQQNKRSLKKSRKNIVTENTHKKNFIKKLGLTRKQHYIAKSIESLNDQQFNSLNELYKDGGLLSELVTYDSTDLLGPVVRLIKEAGYSAQQIVLEVDPSSKEETLEKFNKILSELQEKQPEQPEKVKRSRFNIFGKSKRKGKEAPLKEEPSSGDLKYTDPDNLNPSYQAYGSEVDNIWRGRRDVDSKKEERALADAINRVFSDVGFKGDERQDLQNKLMENGISADELSIFRRIAVDLKPALKEQILSPDFDYNRFDQLRGVFLDTDQSQPGPSAGPSLAQSVSGQFPVNPSAVAQGQNPSNPSGQYAFNPLLSPPPNPGGGVPALAQSVSGQFPVNPSAVAQGQNPSNPSGQYAFNPSAQAQNPSGQYAFNPLLSPPPNPGGGVPALAQSVSGQFPVNPSAVAQGQYPPNPSGQYAFNPLLSPPPNPGGGAPALAQSVSGQYAFNPSAQAQNPSGQYAFNPSAQAQNPSGQYAFNPLLSPPPQTRARAMGVQAAPATGRRPPPPPPQPQNIANQNQGDDEKGVTLQ